MTRPISALIRQNNEKNGSFNGYFWMAPDGEERDARD